MGLLTIMAAGASAASALAYLVLAPRPPAPYRTLVKTAAVSLLALVAALSGAPALLVAALILSALGDAFLAHDGDRAFIAGLASFLAAHLVYVVLFAGTGPFAHATTGLSLVLVAYALVLGTVLVRKAGPLAIPVSVYVAAILAMGITAQIPGGWALAGALAFMASDSLLGTERFLLAPQAPLTRFTTPAVWLLYYAGQAMITVAFIGLPITG